MMKAVSCALVRSNAQALSTGLRASGVAVNAVGKPKKTGSTQLHNYGPEQKICVWNIFATELFKFLQCFQLSND